MSFILGNTSDGRYMRSVIYMVIGMVFFLPATAAPDTRPLIVRGISTVIVIAMAILFGYTLGSSGHKRHTDNKRFRVICASAALLGVFLFLLGILLIALPEPAIPGHWAITISGVIVISAVSGVWGSVYAIKGRHETFDHERDYDNDNDYPATPLNDILD